MTRSEINELMIGTGGYEPIPKWINILKILNPIDKLMIGIFINYLKEDDKKEVFYVNKLELEFKLGVVRRTINSSYQRLIDLKILFPTGRS